VFLEKEMKKVPDSPIYFTGLSETLYLNGTKTKNYFFFSGLVALLSVK
jgi:hypothetical protein